VVQHGACLGLGLAALGTSDEEICEDIKNILYTDSAVAGEAAGIGMGLLMVGTASEKATEMLAYAHDTQHEKIIRYAIGCLLTNKFLMQSTTHMIFICEDGKDVPVLTPFLSTGACH
jgi:26S proteasome regulatory subunit N2